MEKKSFYPFPHPEEPTLALASFPHHLPISSPPANLDLYLNPSPGTQDPQRTASSRAMGLISQLLKGPEKSHIPYRFLPPRNGARGTLTIH